MNELPTVPGGIAAGSQIAGYTIEEQIGRGGMAVVYRASDKRLNRPVALKIFKALGDFSEADRQKLLDEFVQEGSLLADLSARTAAIVQADLTDEGEVERIMAAEGVIHSRGKIAGTPVIAP